MNYNSKFLEKYRELEILLRNNNIDFKDFEENQENEKDKQKLRICRIMRNYLSHNDITFIEATKEQIDFITNNIDMQRLQGDIIKKHLGRINNYTCSLYDKCSDILDIMSKRQITKYPVLIESRNGSVYEIKSVSIYDVSKAVLESKTNRIKEIENSLTDDIVFTEPMEDYINIIKNNKNDLVFCTDDGSKNGKLMGFVKIE